MEKPEDTFTSISTNLRLIGTYGATTSDTLIICVGGMHGNEPAGVRALEQIIARLQQETPDISAYFVALRGNLKALSRDIRYIHEDFNRIWSPANIQLARSRPMKDEHMHHDEIQELREMFTLLDKIDFKAYRHKFFIDLHTTSAEGGTFIVPIETVPFPSLLSHLRVPVIDNLVEKLVGTAVMYMHHQGFVAFAFEGGQHSSSQSEETLLWAVWQTLRHVGGLAEDFLPDYLRNYRFDAHTESLPKRMKLKYLHKVKPSDQFEMLPDFQNFQSVKQGQLLAKDRQGDIRATHDGYILMPLYQKEGDDGFFIVGRA